MFAGGAVCFIGAPLCPLVSAVLARGMRAVISLFLRSRDRGSEDAVIFSETGDDGYFDQTGLHEIGLVSRVCKIPVVRS